MKNKRADAAKGTGQPAPKSRGLTGRKVSAKSVAKNPKRKPNPRSQWKKAIR